MPEPQLTFQAFRDDLLIVLVLFKTKLDLSKAWSSLARDSDCGVFIYDNSPESQSVPQHFYYVHDSSNAGVSKAYNEAAKFATLNNKRWLLLLDQDTEFPANSLEEYWKAISDYPDSKIFVPVLRDSIIVSPFRYNLTRGFVTREIHNTKLPLSSYLAANSGMMINVLFFQQCGGYDQDIPLDFSDFAFLHKAKKLIDNFVVLEIVCQHCTSFKRPEELEVVLLRFKTYCEGSRMMIRYTGKPFLVFLQVMARTLKMTVTKRSFRFLSIFFRTWVTGS